MGRKLDAQMERTQADTTCKSIKSTTRAGCQMEKNAALLWAELVVMLATQGLDPHSSLGGKVSHL